MKGNGDSDRPLLTVIVPVYNEAATVDALIHRVLDVPLELQVIVVDDGSTDRTPEILKEWAAHHEIEVLYQGTNRGKGSAIRTGLEKARGRFTIIQDGDLEYDPRDYIRIIEPLVQGRAQVVYGSRYMVEQRSFWQWDSFRWGVSLLNVLVRVLYGQRLTDEATCYKALPTELLRAMRLQCERFEFCAEVTAKASLMGLTIHEVPISYRSRGVRDGKKIRWRDGLAAVVTLWKWRRWKCPEVVANPESWEVERSESADTLVEVMS